MRQDPESPILPSEGPRRPFNLTDHPKKQENRNLNEKRQSAETTGAMNPMLQLSNKDFKVVIAEMCSSLFIFNIGITDAFEQIKHRKSQKIKDMKKNEMEITELKIAMTAIKNPLEVFISRMEKIEGGNE